MALLPSMNFLFRQAAMRFGTDAKHSTSGDQLIRAVGAAFTFIETTVNCMAGTFAKF
jgi:hypothetical protein